MKTKRKVTNRILPRHFDVARLERPAAGPDELHGAGFQPVRIPAQAMERLLLPLGRRGIPDRPSARVKVLESQRRLVATGGNECQPHWAWVQRGTPAPFAA